MYEQEQLLEKVIRLGIIAQNAERHAPHKPRIPPK
jgi:hypothetical protein